jgi:hypothetical protein
MAEDRLRSDGERERERASERGLEVVACEWG